MGTTGRRWIRLGLIGAKWAGGAVVLGMTVVFLLSHQRLSRRYQPRAVTLPLSGDTARGRHLVTSVTLCVHCHAEDFGGQPMADNAVIRLAAPNLTRGKGGRGAWLTDADIERAIRHGIRRDGTPLLVMPSDAFAQLADDDVAAIIAYLRTRPPVDREMAPSRLNPLGLVLLATGEIDEIPAERTNHAPARPALAPTEGAALGAYLSVVSGCSFCHQSDFSGRQKPIGPPGSPVIPAINRYALAGWTEAEFSAAVRTGRGRDGRQLLKFMPWKRFAGMTDAEVHALWRHLQAFDGTSLADAETP